MRAVGAAGSASRWHREGRRFKSGTVHHGNFRFQILDLRFRVFRSLAREGQEFLPRVRGNFRFTILDLRFMEANGKLANIK